LNAPATNKLDTALVKGLAWTAGAKWATQLITWASVLLAARLLSPSDFGLGDMAGLFGAVTSVVAEFGIGTAVMQMRELDRRAIGQLNTISILLGTAAFGLAILAAPLLADFFHTADLKLVVIVNSVHFFITGFQSVPLGLLQKDMDYRRLSLAEAAMAVSQAITLTVCGLLHYGYWSLVAATLTGHTVAALCSSWWKPVPFVLPRMSEILSPLRMGWHVAVSRAAWSAYAQADAITVGRTMGTGALGSYRLAVNLASAPAEKLGMLVMRVSNPLFAKVQNDTAMIRRYFLIFTDTLALGVCPLMFGLATVAPDFIAVVLGPRWSEAVAPLRWLAIYVAFRTMNTLIGQVLTSLRYTRFMMWISLLTAVVMVTSFVIASRWGPGAVAAAWLVMAPVTFVPPAVLLLRAIRLPFREYANVLAPSLVGSAVMVAAVLAVAGYLPQHAPAALRLAVQVAAGSVVYGAILLVFYRQRVLRYTNFLRQLRKGNNCSA
jgi:PST family polysaccharide transporter